MLETAIAWLRDRRPDMEALLQELVSVNSFTQNRKGGNRVGAVLRRVLESPHLACTVHPSDRYADHLVFSTAAPGAPAVLVGHLDTVHAPGTFDTYRSDAVHAMGPGVHDMKGGLVVAAFALLALETAGALAELPIRFVVVSDEEVGSPEGRVVLRAAAAGARAGLVVESGRPDDGVLTQRKGTGTVVATAHGKASHAGNARAEGISAIRALARFVERAESLTDAGRGVSVNVGTIAGGRSKNTVPDLARCEVDIRFCTAKDAECLVADLSHVADDTARSMPGATITLEGGVSRLPMERTEKSAALLARYLACASASGLGAVEAPLAGGGSDGNTLAAEGIPCIDALGPRGAGLHTTDERIDLGTLVPKAEALVRLLFERN